MPLSYRSRDEQLLLSLTKHINRLDKQIIEIPAIERANFSVRAEQPVCSKENSQTPLKVSRMSPSTCLLQKLVAFRLDEPQASRLLSERGRQKPRRFLGTLGEGVTSLDRRIRVKLAFLLLLVALVATMGCKKKVSPPSTATAPPASMPAPTASITASPNDVTAGQQIVLTWKTTNATSVKIDGIGDVSSSGAKNVVSWASTTYHLVAHGAAGTADAS